MHKQQVFDLVGHIYGVVLDASRWITVQQDLVQLTDSRTEGFAEINLATGTTRLNAAITCLASGSQTLTTITGRRTLDPQAGRL